MRIAVYGAGGIGGYIGGRLAQAEEEVALIARGQHLEAIRDRGLRIDSINGDVVVRPTYANDDPAEIGPVDEVILGVRANASVNAFNPSSASPATKRASANQGAKYSARLIRPLSFPVAKRTGRPVLFLLPRETS